MMQSALVIALVVCVLSLFFEPADAATSNPTRENGQLSQVLKQFAHLQAQFEEQNREFLAQKTADRHLEQEVQSLKEQLAGEVRKEQRLELRQQVSDAYWGKLHSIFTDGSARLPGNSLVSSPFAESHNSNEDGAAASAAIKLPHQIVKQNAVSRSPVIATPPVVGARAHAEASAAKSGSPDTKVARHIPPKASTAAEATKSNVPTKVVKTLTSVHLKREKNHVMKRWGLQKSATPSKTVVLNEKHAAGTEVTKDAVVSDDTSVSPFDALENQLKAENQKIDDLAGGVEKDDGTRSSNNAALGAGDAVEGDQSHPEASADGGLDASAGSSDGKAQTASSTPVARPADSNSDVASKEEEEADAVLSGGTDTNVPTHATAATSPQHKVIVKEAALPQLRAAGKAVANAEADGTKATDSSDDWEDDAQTAKLFQKLNR